MPQAQSTAEVTLSRWDKRPLVFVNGDLPQRVIDALDEELAYEDPDAEWSDAYKNGEWDGMHRLFRQSANGNYYFPVGLLGKVRDVLDAFGIEYEVEGIVRPGRGDLDVSWDTGMELRDYQQDAIDDCLRHGSGMIVLPTGAGKTVIGIRLIYELRRPTIVLCHQQEIARQWCERLRDILDVEVAEAFAGDDESGDVQVALYQTVYQDGEVRDDIRLDHDIAICDEAHRVAADTFSDVALSCNAVYRYGMTATPEREDNATLRVIGGTGPVISDLSPETLIDQGYLAEPKWEIYESPMAGVNHKNWQEEYKGEIVTNEARNRKIADAVAEIPDPTLVTVERINHGERLSSMIPDAEFIHGSASDREEHIEAFRSGDLGRLVATRGIVGEGFDVPRIASFVVAGGYKSSISVIQQVGRALRPETDEAVLVDFLDKGKWVSQHSEERIRTYRDYYGEYGP